MTAGAARQQQEDRYRLMEDLFLATDDGELYRLFEYYRLGEKAIAVKRRAEWERLAYATESPSTGPERPD